ncbi:MAG: hypothetical protein CM15mP74_09070 [Halieaceae bacterium]|nr:MAG: hypothetical protein CM15mP74_09070 [Halieaceae bacterium]
MTLVCEDIALPENRVTLSDRVDSNGIACAHTHHDLAPTAAARWVQRMSEGEEILRAAGAQEVWSGPRIGMPSGRGGHEMTLQHPSQQLWSRA